MAFEKPESVFSSCGSAVLACIGCEKTYSLQIERYRCECGALIEVRHPRFASDMPKLFDERRFDAGLYSDSGVWRFRECVLPAAESEIVSHPEGNTRLYTRQALAEFAKHDELYFKHEGENPSGSFKDRGMTVAVTQAARLGRKLVGCASTGNTSASLAAYAAQTVGLNATGAAHMKALVFLPEGKVAAGKLAQAYAYGATCVEVGGDFDQAMGLIQQASSELGLYLVNSVNPFRLEGQKTIIWEMLQQLSWKAPDWIVVPGGNLGNTSAFGKALREAYLSGWIGKLPRVAVIQAANAAPFFEAFVTQFRSFEPVSANTIATAIRIGNPVNYVKAALVVQDLNGVVETVTDEEIRIAKAAIDRSGLGCEPASACSLAGVRKLVASGVIRRNETVVGVLTGHILKDPELSLEIALSAARSGQTLKVTASLDPLREYLKNIE